MIAEKEYTVEWQGRTYVQKHGSPFDRGSADSYYGRGPNPHYYPNGTYNNPKIEPPVMTAAQVADYMAGYDYNEAMGDKKDWG